MSTVFRLYSQQPLFPPVVSQMCLVRAAPRLTASFLDRVLRLIHRLLRDLLHAPWLQVRDSLPEDGEAQRFNKIGDALDVSHVQMARYLGAADYALRQALAPQAEPPDSKARRYYARDQRSYTGPMKFNEFNTAPERATFPVLGFKGQPEVRLGNEPITVGKTNAELRELEGVGVVASAYEPIEPKFNNFRAPIAGRYQLRFNAYSVWVGPGPTNKRFIPDLDNISVGRRSEPVTITVRPSNRFTRAVPGSSAPAPGRPAARPTSRWW